MTIVLVASHPRARSQPCTGNSPITSERPVICIMTTINGTAHMPLMTSNTAP